MSEVASRVVYCVAFDAHDILFFLLFRYPPVYIIAALSIMIKYWQHRWGLFRQWMPAKMYGDDLIVQTHRIYNAFAFISFVSAAILNGILLMTYRDDEGNVIGPVLWCVWCAVTLGLLAATTIVVNVSGREEVRLFIKNRFPGMSRFYCFPMDEDEGNDKLWNVVEKSWLVDREKRQIGELGLHDAISAAEKGSEAHNFHLHVQQRFKMLYKLRLLRGFDSTRGTAGINDPSVSVMLGDTSDNGSGFSGSCYAPFYYRRLLNFDVKKWELGSVCEANVASFFSHRGTRWEYNSAAKTSMARRNWRHPGSPGRMSPGRAAAGGIEMATVGGEQTTNAYPAVPAPIPRAASAPAPAVAAAASFPVPGGGRYPIPGGGAYPAPAPAPVVAASGGFPVSGGAYAAPGPAPVAGGFPVPGGGFPIPGGAYPAPVHNHRALHSGSSWNA